MSVLDTYNKESNLTGNFESQACIINHELEYYPFHKTYSGRKMGFLFSSGKASGRGAFLKNSSFEASGKELRLLAKYPEASGSFGDLGRKFPEAMALLSIVYYQNRIIS
jgi:hypothetical protein